MPEKNIIDALNDAINLANKFRYCNDKKYSTPLTEELNLNRTRVLFSHNYLKISKQVTPALSNCLNNVFDNLNIDSNNIDAYIYPSHDIQAECLAAGHGDCIIRFSSGLIDLLDDKEIEFVAGHEIAHFLLRHHGCKDAGNESAEYYINKRAQELSADRLGYISCNSLDVALRALMKTMSGLTSKHLRFDISSFIDQIRTADNINVSSGFEVTSTHPSILLRCRALLWFSLVYDKNHENVTSDELKKIDVMIKNDMDKYVDKASRILIDEAKEQVKFWSIVYKIISIGAFTKSEQEKILLEFGDDKLESLKNLLRNLPKNAVEEDISKRLQEAKKDLYEIAPTNYNDDLNKIDKYISSNYLGK